MVPFFFRNTANSLTMERFGQIANNGEKSSIIKYVIILK